MAPGELDSVVVLAGSAHAALARSIADGLSLRLGASTTQRFPDGEMGVSVGPGVEGRHVVIVQPTGQPCGENVLELVLLGDACRRSGAKTLTAVIPYVGYARQDHRTEARQALGMRAMADLVGRRFERIVAVDLHSSACEGFFHVPVEHVSAVPLLAGAVMSQASPRSVVVAPDLGAVKLARGYASVLGVPMAIVHKTRLGATEVVAERVIGDVRGLEPIIVDDMVTTGGTIVAAAGALKAEGCARWPDDGAMVLCRRDRPFRRAERHARAAK